MIALLMPSGDGIARYLGCRAADTRLKLEQHWQTCFLLRKTGTEFLVAASDFLYPCVWRCLRSRGKAKIPGTQIHLW